MRQFQLKKNLVILGILVLSLFGCTSTPIQSDKDKSNGVLANLQKLGKDASYEAESFTLAQTKASADKMLDQPDLVGQAMVTSESGLVISVFKTFGSCYPETTQSTNPQQVVGASSAGSVIAQVEPGTGLYSPAQSDGTICVTTTGAVLRFEQKVFWSSVPFTVVGTPIVTLQPQEGGRVNVDAIRKAAAAFKADRNKENGKSSKK